MLCREIMSPAVHTCRESTPVSECARLMRDWQVGFIAVVNADGQPLGVITDRDLAIRALASERPPRWPVGEVMTRPPLVTCTQDEELHVLEHRMGEAKKSRALVVDHFGKLCGIITLGDIAAAEPSTVRRARLLAEVTHRPQPQH